MKYILVVLKNGIPQIILSLFWHNALMDVVKDSRSKFSF